MNTLTELRQKNNLLLEVVARATKVPLERLQVLELGESKPTAQETERLATLYGVEPYHVCDDYIYQQTPANECPPTASAAKFLQAALQHQQDRANQRDTPNGERSMAKTVTSFNAMYDTHLTEEQGWMFMVFLKASRASQGKFVADDYEDGTSYFSLAGEAAAEERAA